MELSLLLLLALLLLLLLVLADAVLVWRRAFGCRLPPGPGRLPFLGAMHRLDPEAPYLTLTRLSKRYGKVFTFWMGQRPCVVIADPDVLKRCFAKKAFSGRAPLDLVHKLQSREEDPKALV